jgi:FkbM family methyltransferase
VSRTIIKSFLSSLPLVRPLFIECLRATARDIQITNPWTRDRLLLNTYRHKGYWYFGRDREWRTMGLFRDYIKEGDTVIEIGGHIGFITQYFSRLVGDSGRVIVFEPGSNNLPYIERNISGLHNVQLERKAIADRCGTATFYEDDVTGQNNSLLSNYRNAAAVARTHGGKLRKTAREVELTTLDSYLCARRIEVNFVKMDIEGYELQALQGMTETLKGVRTMIIEVTENHKRVSEILSEHNYEMRDEEGRLYEALPESFAGNIFVIKR